MTRSVLVTGGSGYFGTVLAAGALARGDDVRILDLNRPGPELREATYVAGDVRDPDVLDAACEDVDVVFHAVAQVPLARDRALFASVNVAGTGALLVAARRARVRKVVHVSSSAVFGIPEHNPVDEAAPCRPQEDYGRAKVAAELLCDDAIASGLDVTIIRPRTILGHGRLGIIALLFEFVADGAPAFVFDGGHNRYQFVHADDLARACFLAGDRPGPAVYNIGAAEFGTIRETLQALTDHAATGARVRSLPSAPARVVMRALARLGLAPFAPYHWLLYGESLYFDITRARSELGWEPQFSNAEMLIESYESFLSNRERLGGADRSHHQSPVRPGLVRALKLLP